MSGLELSESDYANLVLIVDKGERYLTGWISDENGIAIEKAMVTLDATITDGSIEYFSYRSRSTDSTGKFSFDNVAGGDHRISVYANGFDKLDIQHRFHSQSDQVHLTLTRQYLARKIHKYVQSRLSIDSTRNISSVARNHRYETSSDISL
ncbi:MAG: carboxypeptidase regulatory-like domain-containing protein [Gammaproteobacteria bacterium]|nr:carboxypeptidase regulatory-like domain-containing protein [Gammaproteobacteria bacterium]